jgi:hypothetical protein
VGLVVTGDFARAKGRFGDAAAQQEEVARLSGMREPVILLEAELKADIEHYEHR